jgi:Arc/MetJ-type ribon-helix-helix transcriptional regulator
MNIIFEIPEELQTHVMKQVQTGDYSTTIEYVLDLVMRDRDRTLAQENLGEVQVVSCELELN